MGTEEPFLPESLAEYLAPVDKMSDLLDDGSFMFTSESVGEGHPGESSISYLCVRLGLEVY